ncbi:unnamed protein product [Leptidea sinapis]|uniref:Reverse transcriptase domain-containing protein n=1 Tax=Leptidea sinapis TaxID=189913 RepID=A0A5E4R1P7_9NEOP|nr:unnamed protein product [Leptidea sinapis]
MSKTRFITELNSILNKVDNSNLLLIGDMNIENVAIHYLDSPCEKGLISCINQYTRVAKKGDLITKSCIDHIFVRCMSSFSDTIQTAVIQENLADHYITACAFVSDRTNTINPTTRLRDELHQANWCDVLSQRTPDEIYCNLKDKFNCIYNKCRQIKVVNTNNRNKHCKWIDKRALFMSKQKQKLYRIWKKEQTMENKIIYNSYRNKTNMYINYIKNKYYKKLIEKHFTDSKLWKIINELSGKSSPSIEDVVHKYFSIPDVALANKFAQEFSSNLKNLGITCCHPILPTLSPECLEGSIIATNEYLIYVNNMCRLFKHGSVYQFADDTCIVVADTDIKIAERKLQENFDAMCQWSHNVGLAINAQKTKFQTFNARVGTFRTFPTGGKTALASKAYFHRTMKTCQVAPSQLMTHNNRRTRDN